jgi:hypothetical protein
MAFLGQDDILVLEKEKGTVQRIVNGMILPTPVLTVNVATEVERCMCGIAVSKSDSGNVYVFLYFTEAAASGDGGTDGTISSGEPIGNRLRNQNRIDVKMWPKGLIKFDIIFRSCLFFKDTTGRYTLVRIRWNAGQI